MEPDNNSEYNQPNKKWFPGYVYVIDYGDKNTFKIGHTVQEPSSRLAQISAGNVVMPMHLVMSVNTFSNCILLEDLLHMQFDNNHVRGEWFKFDFPELVDIYQVLYSFGIPVLYERWFDIVPEDHKKDRSKYFLSDKFPPFTLQEQYELDHVFDNF